MDVGMRKRSPYAILSGWPLPTLSEVKRKVPFLGLATEPIVKVGCN